jgi:ribonuclease P protein component
MMSHSRYTPSVPNRRSALPAISEHVYVCSRYVSMESLAVSVPVARSGDVDRGAARARTPESVIIRRDLELERLIGCAEANVSAQADQAHPQVWLPGPHGRSRRPRRAGPATAQGTSRAYRRGREQVHAESLGDLPARGGWSGTPAGRRSCGHGAYGVERRLRLRRGGDVRTARSRGRVVSDGPLVLRYLPNPSDPPRNRYGVVAGRKSGGSVQRNRLKRVTREALRALHPTVRPGYDLVVIIRGTVEELPGSGEARQLLARMLRRAGLLDTAATGEGEQP